MPGASTRFLTVSTATTLAAPANGVLHDNQTDFRGLDRLWTKPLPNLSLNCKNCNGLFRQAPNARPARWRPVCTAHRMAIVVRNPLSHIVIGCAIEVHRALGPGLLESAYLECLGYELAKREVRFQTQVPLPIEYDGHRLNCGYRMDLVVPRELLVEVKSVDKIAPVHMAQVMTYLKLSGLPQALLLNFNVRWMRDGIRSFLHTSGRIQSVGLDLPEAGVQPPS